MYAFYDIHIDVLKLTRIRRRDRLESTDHAVLKRLARKGIPSEYRGRVWYVLSGAIDRHAQYQNLYSRLVQLASNSVESGDAPDSLAYVDKDIDRTYPEHPLFRGDDDMRRKLRNILYAYAMHNPNIGYCQSMNFIAGILLFHMDDEERAFWCFDRLISHIMPSDIYESGMNGLFVQVFVLKQLLRERRPKLHHHFEKIGVDITLFTTAWFLAIYTISFPPETALRVWDALFSEGYKIVYRVALALFQLQEPLLLQCRDVGEVMQLMQKAPHTMFNARKLMKAAFAIKRFSWKNVMKHRTEFSNKK